MSQCSCHLQLCVLRLQSLATLLANPHGSDASISYRHTKVDHGKCSGRHYRQLYGPDLRLRVTVMPQVLRSLATDAKWPSVSPLGMSSVAQGTAGRQARLRTTRPPLSRECPVTRAYLRHGAHRKPHFHQLFTYYMRPFAAIT
jgi:hypothetical protein